LSRAFLIALALVSLALPAGAAIEAGTTAPDFTAPASLDGHHSTFTLSEARKAGPVVVYFYPSAFTEGCDAEAHAFATRMDEFTAAGAKVVGVSLDSVERLDAFSKDPAYCAGKLMVVSDADGAIARSFGLTVKDASPGAKDVRGVEIGHGFAQRVTFVVGADGKVVSSSAGIPPTQHVDEALAAVQKLGKHEKPGS
jgi:peroxiredoxin